VELAAAAALFCHLRGVEHRRDERHPFDVVEGESEIVAAHGRVLGHDLRDLLPREYANMILCRRWRRSCSWRLGRAGRSRTPARTSFQRGRCRCPDVWLFAKVFVVVSLFIWFEPRSHAIATTRSCGSAGRFHSDHAGVADPHRDLDADAGWNIGSEPSDMVRSRVLRQPAPEELIKAWH